MEKRKKKATSDADRTLGFVPYAEFTCGEVSGGKPGCVKFLAEGGSNGNLKGRFTHWVMASMVDSFFLRGEDKQEEAEEARIAKRT